MSRLRQLKEEESERNRKKRDRELEFEAAQEKIRRIMQEEIASHFTMPSKIMSERISYKSITNSGVETYESTSPFRTTGLSTMHNSNFPELELLGVTMSELDEQCFEIFDNMPFNFVPRKNSKIDEHINRKMLDLNFSVPVEHIKLNLYLIGSNRVNVDLKNDNLIVHVGGGSERFEDYVSTNLKYFQRQLVVYMLKSGESLEWVIDQLIAGHMIKNVHLEAQSKDAENKKAYARKKATDRVSSPLYDKSPSRSNSPIGQRRSSFTGLQKLTRTSRISVDDSAFTKQLNDAAALADAIGASNIKPVDNTIM